ncbi:MAG: putative protein-export membrane protein SecG [Calditrichaeota bacterium]|nr:putative protein-export membrane protein SecG [Calditrichota bacterium]
MLYGLLLVIHILVSILLVVTILMQASKGGGLAGIAGGMAGASSQMFGGRQAATLLHKVTVTLALVFGINALILTVLSRGPNEVQSVTQRAMQGEGNYPLEFLGESDIQPTDQQMEQARETVPLPAEQSGKGGGENAGGEQQPASGGD